MRVLKADAMGLCFGVRDALHVAWQQADPRSVTIHGELVHNESVLDDLRQRGFAMVAEDARDGIPSTDGVLITAHGVSRAERKRLESAGKQLIDTTCPLVAKVHEAARLLDRDGYHVVVIGKPGHVEVRGIVGDLPTHDVVRRPEDVRDYGSNKVGIVCQTTFPETEAAAIALAVRAANPDAEVRFLDTICAPTKRRIAALEELLPRVDAMVVVGGARSNNTRHLVELCESHGVPAQHVQGPDDIDAEALVGCGAVGLTAGTSTPDASIDAVHAALVQLAALQDPTSSAT